MGRQGPSSPDLPTTPNLQGIHQPSLAQNFPGENLLAPQQLPPVATRAPPAHPPRLFLITH